MQFEVTRAGAACRLVGSFAVHGQAGANRVPISARVGRRLLPTGRYRVLARRGPEALFAMRIVVARGRVVASQIVPVASSDACNRGARPAGYLLTPSGPLVATLPPLGTAPSRAESGAVATPQDASPQQQALGAQFTRSAASGLDLPRLFVLAAAGLALVLLAAATLPDQLVPLNGLGIVLLRRRVEIALAGTSTLVAAVLVYFVYGR